MTRGRLRGLPLLALAVVAAVAWGDGGASAQLLRCPVTCSTCISDYYYVDQGLVRDYDCGNSTYSDHTGSDYSLRNGNFAIDNDNEVVAMAAGTVVKTEDGYFDRCTQCGGANCGTGFGNGFANQVVINHGPYRVIYGHMKMGSIAVAPGDSVECGQVIGFIGSSGCSTGAHLHIEPSDAASYGSGRYTPIDAYAGDCSPTPASLFVDQGAYRSLPGAACDDAPPVPTCPADSYDIWTCSDDLTLRRRCVDGVVSDEPCPWGCSVMAVGTNDVCALPPDGDGDGSRADVDCDDASAASHPGAVDVCGDGLDQDCSGDDAVCPPPGAEPTGGAAAAGAGAAAAGGLPAPVAGQAGVAGAAGQGAIAGQAGVAGQAGAPWNGAAGQAGVAGQAGAPWNGAAGNGASGPLPMRSREPEAAGCAVLSRRQAAPPGWLALVLAAGWSILRSRGSRGRRRSGHGPA